MGGPICPSQRRRRGAAMDKLVHPPPPWSTIVKIPYVSQQCWEWIQDSYSFSINLLPNHQNWSKSRFSAFRYQGNGFHTGINSIGARRRANIRFLSNWTKIKIMSQICWRFMGGVSVTSSRRRSHWTPPPHLYLAFRCEIHQKSTKLKEIYIFFVLV